jgi:hypothetical protein
MTQPGLSAIWVDRIKGVGRGPPCIGGTIYRTVFRNGWGFRAVQVTSKMPFLRNFIRFCHSTYPSYQKKYGQIQKHIQVFGHLTLTFLQHDMKSPVKL